MLPGRAPGPAPLPGAELFSCLSFPARLEFPGRTLLFRPRGRDVRLRERAVARLAAGQGLAGQLGPLQPLVLRQLSPGLPPLQPVVVAGPEPLPLPQAPPAEVPALLALLLAQPLVVAQPPARGAAPGIAPQAPRVSAAGPLPQPLALPEVAARAPPLRLRAHRVPGAARPAPGAVPHQVPQQDPLPAERERSNGAVRNSKSQCSESFRNNQL